MRKRRTRRGRKTGGPKEREDEEKDEGNLSR